MERRTIDVRTTKTNCVLLGVGSPWRLFSKIAGKYLSTGRPLVFRSATLADAPWATVWPRVAFGGAVGLSWPSDETSPTWANVALEIAALDW
jgi:hypothetical protein